jgi:hypothetical protein
LVIIYLKSFVCSSIGSKHLMLAIVAKPFVESVITLVSLSLKYEMKVAAPNFNSSVKPAPCHCGLMKIIILFRDLFIR